MKKVINLLSKIGDVLVVIYDVLEVVIVPLILLLVSGVILEVIVNHLGWSTDVVYFFMTVGTYAYLYYLITKVSQLFFIKSRLILNGTPKRSNTNNPEKSLFFLGLQ
jgi:hypothetical protein